MTAWVLYQVLIVLAMMVVTLMIIIGVCQMVLGSRASRREEQERR